MDNHLITYTSLYIPMTQDNSILPVHVVLAWKKDLFELLLGMDTSSASRKPCSYESIKDTIKNHTGLDMSVLTHAALYASHEERWNHDWYQMFVDATFGLCIKLCTGVSGESWMDVWENEFDHLRYLYDKNDGVGQIRGKAKQGNKDVLFQMLLEMLKCRVLEIGKHEGGIFQKNHAAKLQFKSPFPPQDFSVANCQSGTFEMLI